MWRQHYSGWRLRQNFAIGVWLLFACPAGQQRVPEQPQDSTPALEQRLLSGLQDKVLREEFIDYEILGRQEESQRRHEAFEWRLKALRDETQRIEAELKRLAEMIAVGNGSPTIMAAITEREARLRGDRARAGINSGKTR